MAEQQKDSCLSYILNNYTRLRHKFNKECLAGKSKIDSALELYRIIFILTQETGLIVQFEEKFDNVLKLDTFQNISWSLAVSVKKSIMNHVYKVVSEQDGSPSVKLMLCEGNHPLIIGEDVLCTLLKKCEEIIVQLVEQHHKAAEFESEHLSTCSICLNEKAFKSIIDNRISSSKQSIQEGTEISSISHSLSDKSIAEDLMWNLSESFGHESDLRKGKFLQSIPDTKEIVGTKGPQSNEDYDQYKKEIEEKSEAHKEIWKENWKKIFQERDKRPDGDALNYVLTYHHVRQNKIMCELFHDEQQALQWVYNSNDVREKLSFCRIRNLVNKKKTRALMTGDLASIDVELINPSTGEVISKRKGLFDTGADIASFPLGRKMTESLINAVTRLNGELVPIVYAKLRINGHELKTIYPIEMEKDEEWCSIGIPQMADLGRSRVRSIMKEITNILTQPI